MPDPTVTAEAPKATTSDLLHVDAEAMADLAKVEQEYKAKGQEISGYYKDAADEMNRILGLQEQGIQGLEQKGADLRQQAGALPKPPTAPEELAVPSRQLRPFGDLGQNPSTVQLLNGTLMQLGLLAQMGMGMAKGYPAGALAAYSGALEGWAKGDAVRAENMWKEYVAGVAKMDREYRRQRQEYQDILEKYGISHDLLKTEAQLFGIRQGWQDKMIALAGRKPEEALKMFQMLEQPLTQVRQGVYQLKAAMIKAQLEAEQHRIVNDQRQQLLDLKKKEAALGGIGGGGLSQSALEREARAVAAGAPMPSLGWGKTAAAMRIQIANRAAAIMDEAGDPSGSLAMRRVTYAGSKAELTKLLSQRGPLMAFAATADKNLKVAESLSERVDRSGSPVLNRWFLAGRRATGDPDVAAFDTAVRVAINEFAKVTSSATGGGVTSDTARKEVETMLNAAQTPKQFKAVVNTLRQEMDNRKQGYEEQIKVIQQGLGGIAPKAESGVGQELEQELGLK